MSEIISQALTLPVQILIVCVLAICVLLWMLSIFWVHRDARTRSTSPLLWTVVAIVPVAGLIAYCLLRPPYTSMDEDEQGMELDLLSRQLDAYGDCPECGYPVQCDYIVCPNCQARLRVRCTTCGRALKPEWKVCPFCATPAGPSSRKSKTAPSKKAPSKKASKKDADAETDADAEAALDELLGNTDPFAPSL